MADSFQSASTVAFESEAAPEDAEASCSVTPTSSTVAKKLKYPKSGSFIKCQNTIYNKVCRLYYQLRLSQCNAVLVVTITSSTVTCRRFIDDLNLQINIEFLIVSSTSLVATKMKQTI